jgi:hypothetical protein
MISRYFLFVLLMACSLSAVAADSSGFSAGIEEGKAYGAAANAAMPNAEGLDAAAVPGFETSSPPQAAYYGDEGAMSDAAVQAAHDNEAAQTVTEGFVSRPLFTIDRETDPMFTRMGQIEANAASIAGAIQGEYSSCEPVVLETPYPPTTETCYENRPAETNTCDNRLNVNVDVEFSCTAGTWHAQNTAYKSSNDIMYAHSYCEPRDDNMLRFQLYSHGGVGACVGWQQTQLSIAPNAGFSRLLTTLPHWGGGCIALDAWLGPNSGCTENDCKYDFWFGTPMYTCTTGQMNGAYLSLGIGGGWGSLPDSKCYHVTSAGDGSCGGSSTFVYTQDGDFWTPACATYVDEATVSAISGWKVPLRFDKPHFSYTITESWEQGCAELEARSQ